MEVVSFLAFSNTELNGGSHSRSQYERTDGPATHAPGHKIISDMIQLWLSKIILQSRKYITPLKEGSPL